jgi:Zn-dependent M28 family amino/carboxypeptidase
MKYAAYISLLFFIALSSCSDLKRTKQIATIESYQNSLDSIEVVLESNKIDTLELMASSSQRLMREISKNYRSDTVSLDFAKKMDEYKFLVNSIPSVINVQNQLINYFDNIHISLRDLKEDIEHASGKKAKYPTYISFEKKKLINVREMAKDYMQKRNNLINNYTTLHYDMSVFLEGLIHTERLSITSINN